MILHTCRYYYPWQWKSGKPTNMPNKHFAALNRLSGWATLWGFSAGLLHLIIELLYRMKSWFNWIDLHVGLYCAKLTKKSFILLMFRNENSTLSYCWHEQSCKTVPCSAENTLLCSLLFTPSWSQHRQCQRHSSGSFADSETWLNKLFLREKHGPYHLDILVQMIKFPQNGSLLPFNFFLEVTNLLVSFFYYFLVMAVFGFQEQSRSKLDMVLFTYVNWSTRLSFPVIAQ